VADGGVRRRVVRRGLIALVLVLTLAFGVGGVPTVAPAGADVQLPVDPDRDPDETRERAEEILDGDEYQAPGPEQESALDRLREWIGDRVPDLDLGGAGSGGSKVVSWVVVLVVVVGGLTAAALVLARTRGARRAPGEETDADVDVTPLRTADEWSTEAERCEREGDHRGAVRARFRALTTALAKRDLVADTPGRTTGELRGDVADRAPALVPVFAPIADLFERIWFGGDTAGPEQSSSAREMAAAALAAAPQRAVARDDDHRDET
jgi:hypothetical protein